MCRYYSYYPLHGFRVNILLPVFLPEDFRQLPEIRVAPSLLGNMFVIEQVNRYAGLSFVGSPWEKRGGARNEFPVGSNPFETRDLRVSS